MTVKKPNSPKINDEPTGGKQANAAQAKNWTKHNPPRVKGKK